MRARDARLLLWLVIGAGTVARLALAFATVGVEYDIGSFELVSRALGERSLWEVYTAVNVEADPGRYPYLPGLFPWLYLAGHLDAIGPWPYHGVVQLPSIAADGAIAWLVHRHLTDRGEGQSAGLAGAALVSFGPLFVAVSGYHGQIDSIAIAPALAALVVWSGSASPRRALWAGLLIGLGAAVKTVPLLMLIALLPSARSLREGAALVGVAGGVVAAVTLPFLIADLDGVAPAIGYAGAPGLGGLSLALQPNLADGWLSGADVEATAATRALRDLGGLPTVLALAAVGGLLLRRRAAATGAAVVVWLTVYVVASGFYLQYLVWGLPFFIAAGHLRKVAALQLALVLPILVTYAGPWEDGGVPAYVAVMLAVWACFSIALVLALLRVARPPARGREPPTDTSPGRVGDRGGTPRSGLPGRAALARRDPSASRPPLAEPGRGD